ncbi:MAG: ATP-binding cassette domain-containing protein [Firmicutes bacterium]|nr:ATP-binding cassette domain-containing protein [Bacillota bacterium]
MLQLENVSKLFFTGTVNQRVAVRKINLTLEDGDFVTVIGSNGAGKSTLLNLIAGVYPPDRGRIVLDGKEITSWEEARRAAWIGRVFQDPAAGTAPRMTIAENLAIAYRRGQRRGLQWGLNKALREQIEVALADLGLGLEHRLQTKVGLLSGGERQALTLLMATCTQPRLLLLDEHTAALDPSKAALVTQLTERLVAEQRLTTVMVTHNMEQALRLGNRLIMLHSGRILFEIQGSEKRRATVRDLLEAFHQLQGETMTEDELLMN